jgi:LuxR family transcriptional regulator, maltose regulon positive regulatory protein
MLFRPRVDYPDGRGHRVVIVRASWCPHQQGSADLRMARPRSGETMDGHPAADPPPVRREPMSVPALEPRPRPSASIARSTLPFDVLDAKLLVPEVPPASVSRTALVNRLRATRGIPMLAVAAPAGYGKSTLLAQWATRDDRPFAWVTLDERDADPATLLRHVAATLDSVVALPRAATTPLRGSGSVWPSALPRLASALAATPEALVLVLDDAHHLVRGDAADAVSALAEHVPVGSMLVLSGRSLPGFPVALLRTRGRLLELGATELALTNRESLLLLRSVGVEEDSPEGPELVRRAEGWPAGLYATALASGRDQGEPVSGDDVFVADYLRAEVLAGISPERAAFLRRTSTLETMSGPLCDALLERTGSARELAELDRQGLFLVPLDRRRERYRYHRLFRDLLRRELSDAEPDLVADLGRRAADWYEAQGDAEAALEPALTAGDLDRVARLLVDVAHPLIRAGRVEALEQWLARFDDDALLERHAAVAAVGAWVHALRGRDDEAERWLAAADPNAAGAPPAAMVRALRCADGTGAMRADASAAAEALPEASAWRPAAELLVGAAALLDGNDPEADSAFAKAAETAASASALDVRVLALAERSLLAQAAGDTRAADALAVEAREAGADAADDSSRPTLGFVASARQLLRHGRWDEARRDLTEARRLSASLTEAQPWLAVQARLELASAFAALRDADEAQAVADEAFELLRRRPGLGVLVAQAAELKRELAALPSAGNGRASRLTPAELRLLPLLATHLSFREIGERLHVSRNTIKTEAISVYRKLGVSTRSDAVDVAATLGLLQAPESPPVRLAG